MQGMASIHPLQKLNAANHQTQQQQQQLIQSSHLQVPPSSHLYHVASYDSFNFLEQSHGVGFLPTSWSDGQLQQGFEQISGSSPAPDMKAVSLQQQMLSGLLRHSHGFDSGGEGKVESLYSIPGRCLTQPPLTNLQQQQFQQFHGTNDSMAGAAAPKQKVRAKRGQATDPHSIAERLRRERITERVKALQELVPHANKSDRAVMLDEVIEYVKFLRLQVKVLSMSRIGCAAAIAPFFVDVPPYEAASGVTQQTAGTTTTESVTVAEDKVAELMEEDMGSAMQYLQGKGLCLMPISLASTISSATCHPGAQLATGGAESPSSPSLSALTVQSAIAHGGAEV